MRTSIDKAGRLVVPRSLRSQVGLIDGGEVEIAVDGASIRLEAVPGTDLVEEDGFLVIPATGVSLDDATVRELRLADQR
jgi:bifunctional DNA-binding transcriptional regulator/antitoxin component of YhaV-PrlF toxin-antitoxin module